MKKKINTIDLISLGLPVFTVICFILRLIAILTALDSEIGYFDSFAPITYFNQALFFASIAFGIAVSFLTPKDNISKDSAPVNLWSTFASIVLGFVFAIFGLLFLLLNFSKSSILSYVVSAGAFISAIYYIYEGFRPIKKLSIKRALASIIPIVSLIAIIFTENFDFYVALNNPEKQLSMFIFVLAPLFTIQKLKFSAGNPSPRFYLCTAYLTAFLGFYFSVPGIIGNLAKSFDDPKYLLYYLLALALAIYASIDLIGRIKLAEIPSVPSEQ